LILHGLACVGDFVIAGLAGPLRKIALLKGLEKDKFI